MAFYNLDGAEPVVGWLVCLQGEYLGQSFNLKAGRNNIGRALNMDVALAQETSVSRNKHAIITYEPQKREFFIQPGEGNGLTYVNDELIMTFAPLKEGDKIKMGNSAYLFAPLCGAAFTWDEYM
jgi:predicted component of type VI protein secretion system